MQHISRILVPHTVCDASLLQCSAQLTAVSLVARCPSLPGSSFAAALVPACDGVEHSLTISCHVKQPSSSTLIESRLHLFSSSVMLSTPSSTTNTPHPQSLASLTVLLTARTRRHPNTPPDTSTPFALNTASSSV